MKSINFILCWTDNDNYNPISRVDFITKNNPKTVMYTVLYNAIFFDWKIITLQKYFDLNFQKSCNTCKIELKVCFIDNNVNKISKQNIIKNRWK